MRGLQLRAGGWYLRLRAPWGGEIVRSLGTHDRAEAEVRAGEELAKIRAGAIFGEGAATHVAPEPRSPRLPPKTGGLLTLGEAIEGYVRARTPHWSFGTRRAAVAHLSRAAARFGGDTPLGELTKAQVQDWRDELVAAGLGLASTNNVLVALGGLYRWAQGRDVPVGNPAAGARLRTDTREADERAAFTIHELRTVFAGWELDTELDDGVRWVPLLVLYAGLRPQEAAQLAWGDVEEVDGVWCVHVQAKRAWQRVKSRASERLVPLHSELLEAWGFTAFLAEHRGDADHPLFPTLRQTRELAGNRYRKTPPVQHLRATLQRLSLGLR